MPNPNEKFVRAAVLAEARMITPAMEHAAETVLRDTIAEAKAQGQELNLRGMAIVAFSAMRTMQRIQAGEFRASGGGLH